MPSKEQYEQLAQLTDSLELLTEDEQKIDSISIIIIPKDEVPPKPTIFFTDPAEVRMIARSMLTILKTKKSLLLNEAGVTENEKS